MSGPTLSPVHLRARRRARLVLLVEQRWLALLPALGLLLAYLVASLLAVPQRLPHWLQALLLAGLAVGAARLSRMRLNRVRPEPDPVLDRRIEHASGLAHGRLATLSDSPALGDATTDPVWRAHLLRTEAALGRLSAGRVRLRPGRHDRFRMVPILLAVLVLALGMAGSRAPLRLASGFWPWLDLPLGPRPALQAWIVPPDQAGGAPVFLLDPHGRYTVPEGAQLTLSLTGTGHPPVARMPGVPARFEQLSGESWTLHRTLDRSGRIVVRANGYRLADWQVTVQALEAPVVAWTAAPGPDRTLPSHVRLPWSARQKQGVRSLVAELRLAQPGPGPARVLRVPIALDGTPRAATGAAVPDLSADIWAGAPVVAQLVATGPGNREGRSAEACLVLPTRRFRNPLARAVLDVRRRLGLGQEDAASAAGDLQALGDTPGQIAEDGSLFLNLSGVASLLKETGGTEAGSTEAGDRLWQLALSLEDGLHNDRDGARAVLALRTAQDRLSSQLERMRQLGAAGQSAAEQDALQFKIAALAQAVAGRMQAMAAQAAREHNALPSMPDPAMLGGQDLGRMLKAMQDQAAGGHPDQAMRQLERMQAMLEHMRAATPRDLAEMRQQAEARRQAQEQMDAVQDLARRQSALLDRAQSRQAAADRARPPPPGLADNGEDASEPAGAGAQPAPGGPDPATLALLRRLGLDPGQPNASAPATPEPAAAGRARDADRDTDRHAQRALDHAVQELSAEFGALTGQAAPGLKTAGQAMAQAQTALGARQDKAAAQAQMQALAALQQGARQMRSAMQAGGAAGDGPAGSLALLPGGTRGDDAAGPGDADADPGENGPRDPLGRHLAARRSGMDDGDETHVPDQAAPERSREIEQELRRRDSDRTRPKPELDYLDRLLKPF